MRHAKSTRPEEGTSPLPAGTRFEGQVPRKRRVGRIVLIRDGKLVRPEAKAGRKLPCLTAG